MFKFFKRLFTCICLIITIIIGTFYYNKYKNFKNYNSLVKNLDNVSINNDYSVDSSSKGSYFNHPSLNPCTIVDDYTSSVDPNSIEDIANNYTIEMKDIEISQEIKNNSEVNNILSDKSSFDVAIKLNNKCTLVSIDNNSNKIYFLNFDGSNFDSLKYSTDKYINIDLSDYGDMDSLKNKFINANLFGKYDLFSNILKNSDTNLSESDILSLYFTSFSNKK